MEIRKCQTKSGLPARDGGNPTFPSTVWTTTGTCRPSSGVGRERVYYRDSSGRMRFLPARWTSIAVPDPFIVMAAGRACFRLEDLIRLHDRLKQLRPGAMPGVK